MPRQSVTSGDRAPDYLDSWKDGALRSGSPGSHDGNPGFTFFGSRLRPFHPGTEGVRRILTDARVVAVVGFSAKPHRFSHAIAVYLAAQGYRVWGVNPLLADQTLAGIPIVATVQDVPEPVDLVDVFRRSDQVAPIAQDAIAAGARVFWMQDGVIDPASARLAQRAGLEVVMDDCTLRRHRQLGLAR